MSLALIDVERLQLVPSPATATKLPSGALTSVALRAGAHPPRWIRTALPGHRTLRAGDGMRCELRYRQ